jgi:cysteinyl-tRNA synthetase
MTWADFIRRSLSYLGYSVVFARNYTDVGHLVSDEDEGEDKMEKGARREGKSPQEIADKYIRIFEEDTRALNILEPTYKPRATEYIKQMIEMVQKLLDTGHAYITEHALYFDVSTFKDYNKLNHQKIDFNQKGMGKGTADDPEKKHFADFALWFFKKGAHKNALQTWSSPWGKGFPGWHIECSVMSKSLLGNTIDIHMGGVEHIPVHHTNEIAQSESANGVKFVDYWLHNEHLNVDNAKMAKSQGTGFTLQEIREKGFDPLDLRYFFMQAHYRSKQNFTWESLGAARTARERLMGTVAGLKTVNIPVISSKEALTYADKFRETVSSDFQIPQALALMWELLSPAVKIADGEKYALILDFDAVFGLRLDEAAQAVIPAEITDLADKRAQAKTEKNFELADRMRKQIEDKGYLIDDSKEGYKIKKK